MVGTVCMQWSSQLESQSIAIKDLLPIVIAMAVWGHARMKSVFVGSFLHGILWLSPMQRVHDTRCGASWPTGTRVPFRHSIRMFSTKCTITAILIKALKPDQFTQGTKVRSPGVRWCTAVPCLSTPGILNQSEETNWEL